MEINSLLNKVGLKNAHVFLSFKEHKLKIFDDSDRKFYFEGSQQFINFFEKYKRGKITVMLDDEPLFNIKYKNDNWVAYEKGVAPIPLGEISHFSFKQFQKTDNDISIIQGRKPVFEI